MQFKTLSQMLFGFIFLGIVCNACNQNASQTKTVSDSTQNTKEEKVSAQKEVEAIYQDCTVYAGSTIFFFKTIQGDTIQVSILNKGMEEAEKSAKVPENLVDDSKDLEGVPGANPKMIGKKFKIIYDDKKEVSEVKLIN